MTQDLFLHNTMQNILHTFSGILSAVISMFFVFLLTIIYAHVCLIACQSSIEVPSATRQTHNPCVSFISPLPLFKYSSAQDR